MEQSKKNNESDNFLQDSLDAMQKYFDNTPDIEKDKIWEEVNAMGIEGPTVSEYFESLSGNQRIIFELNSKIEELQKEISNLKAELKKNEI